MKLTLVLVCIILCSCNSSNSKSNDNTQEHLRHVGDILFDVNIDDPNFKLCHEDLATVHYAFQNPDLYLGEKPALTKPFYEINFPEIIDENGYITIRFIVNCEGKTGRFRVEELDINYKEKKFNAMLVNTLLSTTKSLDAWLPGISNDMAFDYLKYLTFKIKNNQIIDILP